MNIQKLYEKKKKVLKYYIFNFKLIFIMDDFNFQISSLSIQFFLNYSIKYK